VGVDVGVGSGLNAGADTSVVDGAGAVVTDVGVVHLFILVTCSSGQIERQQVRFEHDIV
jgi:hypothetical protein